MAKYHGKNVKVWVADSGQTLRDISLDVDSVDAPSDYGTVDVTGLGDTKINYVVGLPDTKITIKGQFDDLANTGSHTVLSGLLGGTSGYQVKIFPKGSASGYPVFQGSYLANKYNISTTIKGAVMFDAELLPFGTTGGSWTTAP